jgi:hypothetical protein
MRLANLSARRAEKRATRYLLSIGARLLSHNGDVTFLIAVRLALHRY